MGCWIAHLANKLPLHLRPWMRQLPAISAHVFVFSGCDWCWFRGWCCNDFDVAIVAFVLVVVFGFFSVFDWLLILLLFW